MDDIYWNEPVREWDVPTSEEILKVAADAVDGVGVPVFLSNVESVRQSLDMLSAIRNMKGEGR